METGNDLHTLKSYRNRELDPAHGSRYHLSVVAGISRIHTAIMDVVLNRYLLLETFKSTDPLLTLHEIKSTDPVYNAAFKRVQVSWVTTRYTLVPGAFYSTESAPDYMSLVFHENDKKPGTSQDRLRNLDIQNIYAAPERKLPWDNLYLRHHISYLLDYLHLNYKSAESPVLFLHVTGNNADIIVLDGRQLRFCNSFVIKENTDIIYHTLAVMEQVSLKPDKHQILLFGDQEILNELLPALKEQAVNTSLIKSKPAFGMAPELHEINLAHYFLLLNQYRVL